MSADTFASAELLVGASGSTTGDNTGFTLEAGEDIYEAAKPNGLGFGGGRSVWYKWVCPATDTYTFQTNANGGSPIGDSVMTICTGAAVNALTVIQSDDDAGVGAYSLIRRIFTSGITYYIAIDGYNGRSTDYVGYLITDTSVGGFSLSWAVYVPPPTPANDDFANATIIHTGVNTLDATFIGSTTTAEEIATQGLFSTTGTLWYKISGQAGDVTITFNKTGGAKLLVSKGTTYAGLSFYTGSGYVSNDTINFHLSGTDTYYVQFYSYDPDVTFTLSVTFIASPLNDDYVNAKPIPTGTHTYSNDSNIAAYFESNESIYGWGYTTWYIFTTTSAGDLDAYLETPSGIPALDPGLIVLTTGATIEDVVTGYKIYAYGTNPSISYPLLANTTYHIGVDSQRVFPKQTGYYNLRTVITSLVSTNINGLSLNETIKL